jgi:hypothetical protein
MRYKYYLKNSVDIIDGEILLKRKFDAFLIELKKLNTPYGYEIYLVGSYIDYLIKQEPYGDIDFIILAKKLIEIDTLTEFFKEFHLLCKKYNIIYDMMYSTDITEDMVNTSNKVSSILSSGSSKMIRFCEYKSLANDSKPTIKFKPLPDTELFEGIIDFNKIRTKFIEKRRTTPFFNTPIKIT